MKKIKAICLIIAIITISSLVFMFPINGEAVETQNSIIAMRLETTTELGFTVAATYSQIINLENRAILVWDNGKDATNKNLENAVILTNGKEVTGVVDTSDKATAFTFNIPATKYGDLLYFSACSVSDGKVDESSIGEVKSSSVAKYIYTLLGKIPNTEATQDENLKVLLESLLNYGSAAQLYFGYNTDRLANDFYKLFPEYNKKYTLELVTSTSQLKDGDLIILGRNDKNYVSGCFNDDNTIDGIKYSFENNVITMKDIDSNKIGVITLKKFENDTWGIKTSSGAFLAYSENNNKLALVSDNNLDDNCKWNISVNINYSPNTYYSVISNCYDTDKKFLLHWEAGNPYCFLLNEGKNTTNYIKPQMYILTPVS